MTIEAWLQKSIKKIETAGVPTARLDAEVLLADILDKDRSWINAHPEYILQRSDLRKLDRQIKRRMSHEPLAYIRGKQEFYGRDFIVSPDTLTPRPETETMLELLLKFMKSEKLYQNLLLKTSNKPLTHHPSPITVLDVGTGSGCIIITAALELPSVINPQSSISYVGLDISETALKIAKKNAKNLCVKVKFKQFNLLSESLSGFTKPKIPTIILANLPYVPNSFHINLAASHEPGFAIFGGKDGLDYYRLLFLKASKNVELILTESLPPQHAELTNIANKYGFKLTEKRDLILVFIKK
jgi:release factor glutamine methyltransferase